MTTYVSRADLSVAQPIADFAEAALADARLDVTEFWMSVSEIVRDLTPRNESLLRVRDDLQARLDAYHREHPGALEPAAYRALLTEIGYLRDQPEHVEVMTANVDPEIAELAGPQLVVPLLNARFALNAANARWGSLYDALYGTDAIDQSGELAPGPGYNAARGEAVIARGRAFLDEIAPLSAGTHTEARAYRIGDTGLEVVLPEGPVTLVDPATFRGYAGPRDEPSAVLLRHNGLHVEIAIDPDGPIGRGDSAGVQDIVLEAALTTIMDLEDSVAAVDADDKALGYANWRGLMAGTLTEEVTKGGRTFVRTLAPDRAYLTPGGDTLELPGRSVLFVRNVGHLMRTDAVKDATGADMFEGMLDAIMTALGSLSDLRGEAAGGNSRTGSMYIVKPKMHGPDEVAFAVELFDRVEALLHLPPMTLKIGVMDEERRTSVNLAACIEAAAHRIVFINTGFLDRTGDEIHTSLHAGPVVPKSDMRSQPFMRAYEDRNVKLGICTGLGARGQIGKGMWAKPDLMHDMLEQKAEHVRSGASTAWVPSPTAATLHALQYHQVDAFAARRALPPLPATSLDDLLMPPLASPSDLAHDVVVREVDNNVQSILGYVVRWVHQGVGCSKVPDIAGTALMEDRATLRISSQLLANWLAHGVITSEQVDESLRRLASVVDEQNAGDPAYEPLAHDDEPPLAYTAARRLIIEGAAQPSGYTEPLLHELRREFKAAGGR
ncbi:malate synthase G [Pseudoclavibacter endophyticus]|uniref:Malate synthase G n=1 Tax=Pseudoclavibacter endophyticus TaxID=1778590 RepID=A0A6H9WLG1_9MICO|nr:malate synthase G [Pseudoclavibacter endophyticus]KAB1649973.1 malate synthase G [Pseudoclavibacter endophyticus]GGA58263.1 malate synthase G [Pseudoclavibacter endophyticus]